MTQGCFFAIINTLIIIINVEDLVKISLFKYPRIIMKKCYYIFMAAIVIAALGAILFWIFISKDNMQLAGVSFLAAGCSAWIAIIALVVQYIAEKRTL